MPELTSPLPAIPTHAKEIERCGGTYGKSFIYFLMDGDICVYVGETTIISARLNNHLKTKVFDRMLAIPAPEDAVQRRELERQWIDSLNPRYNGEPGRPRLRTG